MFVYAIVISIICTLATIMASSLSRTGRAGSMESAGTGSREVSVAVDDTAIPELAASTPCLHLQWRH